MQGGDGAWWSGEVALGAAHFAFEGPACSDDGMGTARDGCGKWVASERAGCVQTDWVSGLRWAPNIALGVG